MAGNSLRCLGLRWIKWEESRIRIGTRFGWKESWTRSQETEPISFAILALGLQLALLTSSFPVSKIHVGVGVVAQWVKPNLQHHLWSPSVLRLHFLEEGGLVSVFVGTNLLELAKSSDYSKFAEPHPTCSMWHLFWEWEAAAATKSNKLGSDNGETVTPPPKQSSLGRYSGITVASACDAAIPYRCATLLRSESNLEEKITPAKRWERVNAVGTFLLKLPCQNRVPEGQEARFWALKTWCRPKDGGFFGIFKHLGSPDLNLSLRLHVY